MVDSALLEHCLREDLNTQADRVMCVLRPLKVVITNYPEDGREMLPIENNPEKVCCPLAGKSISSRMILWRSRRKNSSA